jgi:hypothetical protein
MTPEQEQVLIEKLTGLGYPEFEIMLGEDDISMLYIHDRFICGALYALSLSDEQLRELIDETVQIGRD